MQLGHKREMKHFIYLFFVLNFVCSRFLNTIMIFLPKLTVHYRKLSKNLIKLLETVEI